MHVKYVTTGNPVLAQVISDLALLCTGAQVSSLSASCDPVNTTAVNTVAPGWTLVDNAAPNSGIVVSAPDMDGLTTKYVRMYAPGSNSFDVVGYEGWNATAHTGTNPTSNSSALTLATNAVNTFWLFATPRTIFISQVSGAGVGAFEFSRDIQYTKGTTYPTFAVGAVSSIFPTSTSVLPVYAPRIKNATSAGDSTAASAGIFACTLAPKFVSATNTAVRANPGPLRDSSENQYYEMRPIWAASVGGYTYGNCVINGRFQDVMEVSSQIGNTFDTFSDGTNTYMVFVSGSGAMALKVA